MQVNLVNFPKRQNPAFCGQRLFSAKLIDYAKNKKRDCFISQMDDLDLALARETIKKWKYTKYGRAILDDFWDYINGVNGVMLRDFTEHRFLMVEDSNEKISSDRIKALAEISVYPKSLWLNYLQSATEIIDEPNRYSGAGGCLLYAIAKFAGNALKKAVICVPDEEAVGFYKKHFFKEDSAHSYVAWILRDNDFFRMQNALKSKYSIKSVS